MTGPITHTEAGPAPEPPTGPDVLDTPEAGGMLIRGSALRAVGFGVITLLSLVSAPLLPRHLGVIGFGEYSQVVALVAIVGMVTEAGIGALVVRELAVLPPDRQHKMLADVLGLRIVLTLLGLAGAMVFAAVAGYGSTLVLGTAVAGLGLLFYTLQGAFTLRLAVELKLGWVTTSDVVRQVVFVGTLVALVVVGAGIVPLLGASIGAGIVGMLIVLWRVRGTVPVRPSFDLASWRFMLRQTLPIAVATALYTIYFRIILLMLSVLATRLETGYYALAFRILEVIVVVPFLLVATALPLLSRAARDDQERLRHAFGRIVDTSLILGTLLALVTFLIAPSAIAFLKDDAGDIPVDVLRIQAATLLAVFLNVAFSVLFIALRRHRELIVVNAVALAATVVAALVLVPAHGAIGAAIAATAGEWLLVAAYVVALARARPDLVPRLWIVPRVLAAAAAAVLAVVLIDIPVLPHLGAGALAALVFVAVLGLLRALPPEVLAAVRRG